MVRQDSFDERKKESLDDEVTRIEAEARMVLPGIQALFGFQLMAVFNQRFTSLTQTEQFLHLLALFCTTIATLLALAPAAYHRLAEADEISRTLSKLGTRFLTGAMFVLMSGICLDIYVITQFVTAKPWFSILISFTLYLTFTHLWFLFPIQRRLQRSKQMLPSLK